MKTKSAKCKIKKFVSYKLLFIAFFIFNFSFNSALATIEKPKPLWPANGLVVNDTPGNALQQNPKLVSDERGGYILVWEDGRYGNNNIFVQKIDETGTALWPTGGVAAGSARGNQNFPQLISDGAGGAIVVWQDYRSGNSDIFAQHLSASGALLWGANGLAVCQAAAGQFAPQLVSDSAGGVIVTWHDYRNAIGEDIYAQRINGQGQALWAKEGLIISAAAGTQWYPAIDSDGSGGAIIAWTDGRNSAANNDIYAQRVDGAGKTLWAANGTAVSKAPGNQEKPVVLALPDGAIIAWNDYRSGNADLYAQKLDPAGTPLWSNDGVVACSLPFAQQDPQLVPDGLGGAIIAWTDNREENSGVYLQRLYNNGRAAWQENGRQVSASNNAQKSPVALKLPKKEEWLILWAETRGRKTNLIAQKFDSTGEPLWSAGGLPVAPAPEEQAAPTAALTNTGDVVVAWQDKRSGNYDIFAQKLSAAGETYWDNGGVVVCAAAGSVVQQNQHFILTPKGELITVFEDARSGYYNIYAQKISRTGELAWGDHGLAVNRAMINQVKPQIVSDGSGGAIIVWEDQQIKALPVIKAQRLNGQGKKVWETSQVLAASNTRQTDPVAASDGSGGAIVCWVDERNPLSLQDLYGQRVSSQGDLLWGKKGKVISDANGNQADVAMIADNQGGIFLAWTDYRNGDRNPDIYAQRLGPNGNVLWSAEGVLVCGAPDIQRNPVLSADGEGGLTIAWTDKGGGSYDIYAQRLAKNGQALWLKDGIPVCQLARTQQNPKFGNKTILVWEDYRFGNWDIFANSLSPAGRPLWGEGGRAVASVPLTQYDPQCAPAPWKNGTIVVWEDYRSGKQYEIYCQMLDAAGQLAWEENGFKVNSSDGARIPQVIADPEEKVFYVFWEDYSGGGRSLYGQKFFVESAQATRPRRLVS